MARGRMITNQICRDKKVYSLSDDTCRLLFTWLITFADREGRVHGDPALVRSMVFPRSEIAVSRVEVYLQELHAVGLILRYEHAGDRFIWFPKFEKNQPGMRKDREPVSELPGPSSDDIEEYRRKFSGNPPEDIRQVVGLIESNGMEGNGREEESPLPLPPRPNIFSVYESEIGPLTPLIGDELESAVQYFTEAWVKDAIHEAATHGARSWAYCRAVLQARKAGRSKPRKAGGGYSQPSSGPLTPEQAERGKKPTLTPEQLAEWKRAQLEKKQLLNRGDESGSN